MGSNISIVPMLMKHRVDKSGKSAIIIRIYKDSRVICAFNTGKKVPQAHWDDTRREVKRSAPNAAIINALILKKKSELESEFLKKELIGINLSSSAIKKIVAGEDPGMDFLAFCRQRLPEKYPGESHNETRRSYFGEITKLQQFQSPISFGDIDINFLDRYKAWMKQERGNSDNTIWKGLKFIHTLLNDARRQGYITASPFDNYDRGKYQQPRRSYLEIDDCDKIHAVLQTDLPNRLRFVAIYYLFMCYTGFRFRDAVYHFNPDQHVINNERIVIDTEKFDVEVNILIHDRLRWVIDFIRSNPLKISNKEFNAYLKVLGSLAGIDVNLTAHVGRHTFGAMLAELDIPISRAQKLLGHKDRKSTEIYYHIKNKELDMEMMKWNKLKAPELPGASLT